MIFRTPYKSSGNRLTEIFLLVLMLWPAPFPKGHCHGDPALSRADNHLKDHLEFYHGGLENAYDWPDGWHWHWSFSGDGYVGLGGERIVADPEGVLTDRPYELPDLIHSYRIGGLDVDREAQLARVPPQRQLSFQSVALLASRQSLPELLGIMRL